MEAKLYERLPYLITKNTHLPLGALEGSGSQSMSPMLHLITPVGLTRSNMLRQ